MINELTTNMAEVKKDLEHIRGALKDNKEEHQELRDMIKEFVASAEKKFAPMWVASSLKVAMTTVFIAVITAILSLVLR